MDGAVYPAALVVVTVYPAAPLTEALKSPNPDPDPPPPPPEMLTLVMPVILPLASTTI